jgi:hypothetical protein
MGVFSRFFAKRSQPSLDQLDEALSMSLRLLKVDMFADISDVYSPQMDNEVARALAAQIANFLMGEDIDEIAGVSEEPLRSRIMAILPQVGQRAAEYMQADRQTREIVVATLRMQTVLNFGKFGTAWFESPAKIRIEQLLVEYGPEFPKEITPADYMQIFTAYHSVKRKLWESK